MIKHLLIVVLLFTFMHHVSADNYIEIMNEYEYGHPDLPDEQKELIIQTFDWFPLKQMIILAIIRNKIRKGKITIYRYEWD